MKAKRKADFSLSLEEQLSCLLKYADYHGSALRKRLPLLILCVLRSQISCMSRNRIYMNAIEMSLKLTFYRHRT